MAFKIGINGFGRIGRLVFRAAVENPNIELVGVNDIVPPDNLAYLLKYDTIHGRFAGKVEAKEDGFVVNGKHVPCYSIRNPAELPWGKNGADYVIESTGIFTDYAGAEAHLKAGAKRVVISAPTKEPEKVPTLLMGVNHEKFDAAKHKIISNASCTTNCLAPVVHVLLKEGFGIEEGLMTTIHALHRDAEDAWTARARRTGRAAAARPSTSSPPRTGAAKAVGLVLPEVKGKLTGMSFRVPTPTVSVVDLTVRTAKETSYKEICAAMKKASEDATSRASSPTPTTRSSPAISSTTRTRSIFDAGVRHRAEQRSSSSW